jgi:hypothetical protein
MCSVVRLLGQFIGGAGFFVRSHTAKDRNVCPPQVCNVLCDIVGIEAFIKLLSAADPE